MAAAFELFHRISDPGSAQVRRFVSDHELLRTVRFRNLVYPEVKADFDARGGQTAPALWDGQVLHQGAEAVIARLKAFFDVGRAS
jgi:hypothetical protein